MTSKHALEKFPIHLGRGGTALREPEFTGMEWYAGYGARHAADGAEGRLVSMFTFASSWTSWEMHPAGAEVVVCTAGKITLHQDIGGEVRTVTLAPGEAAINPPGVWHTADADGPCTALFITAGMGTQVRPP
ncbi:MAG: cupin domain-containing protein [Rhodospirillaceae bacterium]